MGVTFLPAIARYPLTPSPRSTPHIANVYLAPNSKRTSVIPEGGRLLLPLLREGWPD